MDFSDDYYYHTTAFNINMIDLDARINSANKNADKGDRPKQRKWTHLAIECYLRRDCCNCFFDSFFAERGLKCRMRLAVIDTVTAIGIPTEAQVDEYFRVEKKLFSDRSYNLL